MTSANPATTGRGDLRKQPVEEVLGQVERCLGLHLDRGTVVRKRRSVGAVSDRGTWVRIEARPIDRCLAHGQPGNGTEAAAFLHGIAKPAWHRGVSWHDQVGQRIWRADETELITATPIRPGTWNPEPTLPDPWRDTFNTSLDHLAAAHTTRIATPDTERIDQTLVDQVIHQAFPDHRHLDLTITDLPWVPAHADLCWANLTGPECFILDWEDYGLAPRGLDPATLWVNSLAIPTHADRVYTERHTDLHTRPGKIMTLFNLAKLTQYGNSIPRQLHDTAIQHANRLLEELQTEVS